jgi:hypothetical protein
MAYGNPQDLGSVDGVFDALKTVVSGVSKVVRVFQQGATAVLRPPNAPPIYIDLTDPAAIQRAKDAALAVLRGTSVQVGRPPSALDQAGGILSSPLGIAAIIGVAFLVLRRR